jgi:hypothetical protein
VPGVEGAVSSGSKPTLANGTSNKALRRSALDRRVQRMVGAGLWAAYSGRGPIASQPVLPHVNHQGGVEGARHDTYDTMGGHRDRQRQGHSTLTGDTARVKLWCWWGLVEG